MIRRYFYTGDKKDVKPCDHVEKCKKDYNAICFGTLVDGGCALKIANYGKPDVMLVIRDGGDPCPRPELLKNVIWILVDDKP